MKNIKEMKLQEVIKVNPVGLMSEENAKEVINKLNEVLANEYLLFTKTLNYHWNISGPRFSSMHKLLEEQYNSLLTIMDDVAERVKVLGGVPLSTTKELSSMSGVEEHPRDVPSANTMLSILFKDHLLIQEQIKFIVKKEGLLDSDLGTEDFLVGNLQKHEMMAWKLKSNLK